MGCFMKKVILKYLFLYLLFATGIVLFSNGVVNLFSSLLLFVGGYVSIKNTFDYRLVKKNIDLSKCGKSMELKPTNNRDSTRTYIRPKRVGRNGTRGYARVRRK